MTPVEGHSPSRWRSRLETRVALALSVLMLGGLAAVFLATTRIVSVQSHDRAASDLHIARGTLHTLIDERVKSAMSSAELVTELPVFRAHLTDEQLAADRDTLGASDVFRILLY